MSELKIDEKTSITYRQWNVSSPQAILLLVHGLGAHSQRWNFLADFSLQNNFSSYAIELRGFGEAKGLKGDIESFNIYFNDILSLYYVIKKGNPDKKIFLIGESMGGLIAFLIATQEPELFSGLILISPVFKSKLGIPSFNYFKVFFALFYNPKKQIYLPFDSQICTRDIDYQKIMDSDSREHRLTTARLLFNIVFSQMRARLLKNRIRLPVLFLLSGKDELADTQASQRFFQSLRIEEKKIIIYPEMLHALSIDLGRENVFEDMLKWIEKR